MTKKGDAIQQTTHRDWIRAFVTRRQKANFQVPQEILGMLSKDTFGVDDSQILTAYINDERWIVDCPFCAAAEYMWADGLFLCLNCWNKRINFQALKVEYPESKERII